MCADVDETQIVVGDLESLAEAAPSAATNECATSGKIGDVVVIPSEGKKQHFAVQVTVGIGQPTEACLQNGFQGGCIVARRSLGFVPHRPLILPVELEISCIDVPCEATQTCRKGACVSSELPDPENCTDPGGCAGEDGSSSGSGGRNGTGGAGTGGMESSGGNGGTGGTGGTGTGTGTGGTGTGGAGTGGTGGIDSGPAIDITEVTREAYATWLDTSPSLSGRPTECASNASFTPSCNWPSSDLDHPVVCVDWCDAEAYCTDQGRRLCGAIGGGPTAFSSFADPATDQWMAACTNEGTTTYPYGSTYEATTCNGSGASLGTTAAVASYLGCFSVYQGEAAFDMSGNVFEWQDSCRSLDDACRFRGGGYANNSTSLRCDADAFALRLNNINPDLGFRCCAK